MRSTLTMLLLVAAAACDGGNLPRSSSAAPTAQDTLALAVATFDSAMFDSIQWTSPDAALTRGADVFKWACAECHGKTGRGEGGHVGENGKTLRPPSFLAANWRFADDTDGLRRMVFIGNTQGMPHWGLRHILPRDIDAVARYIQQSLRAEGTVAAR